MNYLSNFSLGIIHFSADGVLISINLEQADIKDNCAVQPLQVLAELDVTNNMYAVKMCCWQFGD